MKAEFIQKVVYDKIKDERLASLLIDYLSEIYNDNLKPVFRDIANVFDGIVLENLSWELMCEQLTFMTRGASHLIRFYYFVLKSGIYIGIYSDYLKENPWILLCDGNYHVDTFKEFYFTDSNPLNFFILISGKKQQALYVYVNTENPILRDVLKAFVKYRESLSVEEDCLAFFFKNFEASLSEYASLNKGFESFNFETLKTQFYYYSNSQYPQKSLKYLKSFYVFLIQYFEKNEPKHKVFDTSSGIDLNYLLRDNFSKLFTEGYRVVLLNKFDPVPTFDKWLLAPNSYEKYTTVYKANDYIPVDFSRIKNETMKYEVKLWLIYTKRSLKALKASINNIFIFFEFIEGNEIRNVININEYMNKNDVDSFIINEHNVMVFRAYLNRKYDSFDTINGYISAISSFVKFIDRKHLYSISSGIYDYLRIKSREELKGKVIIAEDLKKIVNALKEIMINGDYLDKLFWLFMHIMITTNFRPSETTSLKRNCVGDSVKVGENVIYQFSQENAKVFKMKRKNSRGKEVEENPSKYTIRAICEAITTTDFLREGTESEIKEYVFIQMGVNGIIEGIPYDTFYRRFKKVTSKLDLEGGPYTVYNCRHTYMTRLFERAVKEGKLYNAIIASGHKDFNTTIKRYIKPEIKDYLEAFFHVKLGNVTITGEIVSEITNAIKDVPTDLRKITVKNGCGFCKGKYSLHECIDCLICRNFVVTIDRIPYFENSIIQIDIQIQNEEILHEKEHLVSIKKLYVGYLGELLTLKEKEGMVNG